MDAVAIQPVGTMAKAPCGWCGLRVSKHALHATPTCQECLDGGRKFRVRMSMQRWKRGQEKR